MCNKKFPSRNMVTHRNDCIDEIFGFCRSCIEQKIENDESPIDSFRLLNIPFIQKLWNEIEIKDVDNVLTGYLKAIAPRKQYKTFRDSEYVVSEDDLSINDEVVARWGSGLEESEYIDLESSFNNLKAIRMPETPLETQSYISQAMLIKKLREAITSGTPKEIKDLQDIVNKGYKSLGLDIVQSASLPAC